MSHNLRHAKWDFNTASKLSDASQSCFSVQLLITPLPPASACCLLARRRSLSVGFALSLLPPSPYAPLVASIPRSLLIPLIFSCHTNFRSIPLVACPVASQRLHIQTQNHSLSWKTWKWCCHPCTQTSAAFFTPNKSIQFLNTFDSTLPASQSNSLFLLPLLYSSVERPWPFHRLLQRLGIFPWLRILLLSHYQILMSLLIWQSVPPSPSLQNFQSWFLLFLPILHSPQCN